MRTTKAKQAHTREQLELERDKVGTSRKRAFQSYLDGDVSKEFFQDVSNDMQKQLDSMNYRLANLIEFIEENFDLARKTIELSYQAELLYIKSNQAQKRRLLNMVLSNCLLKETTLYPTYRKPFDLFVEGTQTQKWRGWLYEFRNFLQFRAVNISLELE